METDGAAAGAAISTAPAAALEIGLVGEVSVRRGGESVDLPRSRKCRALIAYLAMSRRPQRREQLCALLWDVPDDPKGALRWTLSKIRAVLGDALVADRDGVSIDPGTVAIDAPAVLEAAARLESIETETLAQLATRSDHAFGEDLDLPRCPEFQAWLFAQREDLRQAQIAILRALVARLREAPERALPYARLLVGCDPLDEQARLDLLAILAAAGRNDEAEQQRGLARDALRDAGIPVPVAIERPQPKAAHPTRPMAPAQRIQFCTSADGTRIAWSAVGNGPPLVKTANWMSHLEAEWESPILRHLLDELARDRTLFRYDTRGNGMSDRRAKDLSLDAFVADLEAVTANIAEKRFDLVGISQGVPAAIHYAARHPERVRKLVLFGGFASGWRLSISAKVHAHFEALITLTGSGWGKDNPAFRQLFTSQFLPDATPEQAGWFNELQRVSASPEEAQRLQRAIGGFDVRHLLDKVRAPTIVFHCRGDGMVPVGNGHLLASSIAGAEFVGLESDNHLLLEEEPAWPVFAGRLREFLAR